MYIYLYFGKKLLLATVLNELKLLVLLQIQCLIFSEIFLLHKKKVFHLDLDVIIFAKLKWKKKHFSKCIHNSLKMFSLLNRKTLFTV